MPDSGTKLASVEILDLDTWNIQAGPDLPSTMPNGQGFSYNGTVYALKGGNVYELQDNENSWEKIGAPNYGLRPVTPAPIVKNSVFT